MNTKIRVSFLVIGIAAIAIGGSMTGAFFSDTETSTGNTFAAGDIDLKIDSNCTYNNVSSDQCGAWELKDLNPTSDKFFNFGDIKPGDFGENTISIHVYDNDAWVCAKVSNLANLENEIIEPEVAVDQTPDAGELQDKLVMTIWRDDCDNIFEPGQDTPASCNGNIVCSGLEQAQCNGQCAWNPQITEAYCSGEGTCSGLNGADVCNAQCTWNPGQEAITAHCEGTAVNPQLVCSQIPLQNDCIGTAGCNWNIGQSAVPAHCDGEGTCSGLNNETACNAECAWVPEVASGSCSGDMSCSGLPNEQCIGQCTWVPAQLGQGETILVEGHPVNGVLPLYDASTANGPLKGNTTICLGVAWKLPAETGNEVQTDIMTGDVSFYAVQSRNNLGFLCSSWVEPD